MFENSSRELTLHIALATVPQRQEEDFIKSVQQDYYAKYRGESASYCSNNDVSYFNCKEDPSQSVPVLYNPLRYHILGKKVRQSRLPDSTIIFMV